MWALSCIIFVSGCGTKVLNSSEVPVSPVYAKDGAELLGYRAYSDGMMADLMKDCHAVMDQKGK